MKSCLRAPDRNGYGYFVSGITGLVYDPIYKEHDPGRYGASRHPESPARCDAVLRGVKQQASIRELVRELAPRAATMDDLLLCHTRDYIKSVSEDVLTGETSLRTGDTDICSRSYDVALWAVGGCLVAVDAVISGDVKNAFCVVRPPGHHATKDQGMGFCIFNNVALAARYAQKRHGISRVLIVDWDVHHGNGTQDIFYDNASVFYFSVHQWPAYPGTGRAWETGVDDGRGTTMNCPVAAGAGGAEFISAFKEKLIPAMKIFRPEMVLISSGFDARQGDPIGALNVKDSDYAVLTDIAIKIAGCYAGGRIVSVLEGGYSFSGLSSAVCAHVTRLAHA
ncbi:MAG: histone deacetylase [Lentisphaerae bacterium]|nr:histone deacetylase [Lentisphaerota bacterium]